MAKRKPPKLPYDWKQLKIPAAYVVGFLVLVGAGYTWVSANLVFAEDFRQYQQVQEIRYLEREQRTLEREVSSLEAKQRFEPREFKKSDEAALETSKKQLKTVEDDLTFLRRQQKK